MEPTSGFSTYCRKCAQYFRIEPAEKPAGGFLSRMMGGKSGAVQPKTSSRPLSMPLQVMGFSEEADIVAESQPNAARASQDERRFRSVICFECQHHHRVSEHSTSSLCPNCGSYIDLRDVIIKDRTTQKIRTRGDVLVEKKGALLGTSITCGNLTVEGQVAGSVYASGQVSFRASGKVLGEVRCRHLSIEKKCEVHFLQPIHCETAEIYGHVVGRIHLTDRIFLNRKASWDGAVVTKSALMEPGARLQGFVEILPQPIPPPPEFSKPITARPTQLVVAQPRKIVSPEPGLSPAESLALWGTEGELGGI
jgi:cytoskeletal protein CcmA (bactofilin family)/predicted RNA-binding Zn-ribbon protein involved in translation (DUF1610 family)